MFQNAVQSSMMKSGIVWLHSAPDTNEPLVHSIHIVYATLTMEVDKDHVYAIFVTLWSNFIIFIILFGIVRNLGLKLY